MQPTFSPLYKQVKQSLLKRIASGEWTPGTFLPSEPVLAQEYNVSHGTLRKALNELTAEHRVVRYQGKGTAVSTFDVDENLFRFFRIKDSHGNSTRPTSKIYRTEIGKANENEAEALGLRADDTVFRIERVRMLEHEPVLNEYITFNSTVFPGLNTLADIPVLPNTLYNLLQTQFNIIIARAEEAITAVIADEADVQRLNVARQSPLLAVRRIAFDLSNQAVEVRYTRCVTQEFHYCTILS